VPEKKTLERAEQDKEEGKAPSTQGMRPIKRHVPASISVAASKNILPYGVRRLVAAFKALTSQRIPKESQIARLTRSLDASNRQSNVAFEHRCLQLRALSALPQCSSV
jgi:hypothetical protein